MLMCSINLAARTKSIQQSFIFVFETFSLFLSPLGHILPSVCVCWAREGEEKGPIKTQADEGWTSLLILYPAHIPAPEGRSLYDPRAPHTRWINRGPRTSRDLTRSRPSRDTMQCFMVAIHNLSSIRNHLCTVTHEGHLKWVKVLSQRRFPCLAFTFLLLFFPFFFFFPLSLSTTSLRFFSSCLINSST